MSNEHCWESQGATCAPLVKSGETTYACKNAIQVRDFWVANLGKKSDTSVGQDGILPYFLGTTHDQSRAVQLLDARTLGTSK